MKFEKQSKTVLTLIALALSVSVFSKEYCITNFGVGTDSTKVNTVAIQNVIDRAAQKGGGTIVVPKGVFLTGALFFKPNTRLKLLEGAVIKGSDNIADYPLLPSRMEGKRLDYYAALINAYQVDHFEISGSGKIDGNGLKFWKRFWVYYDSIKALGQPAVNMYVARPRLLFVWDCDHVKITGVKLCNSAYWTTHLYQCNDVLIEGCDIRSPFKPVAAPSSDGIDLDVCKRVIIRKCYISVNDDAICMKGGKGPLAHKMPENGIVEDVLVEHCTIGPSHGSITLGSESIHVRNLTVRNCKVENDCPLLRIKLRPDTYQTYENITFSHITGKCGTVISMAPWKQYFNLEGSEEQPKALIQNITLSDIQVKCRRLGEMVGNPLDSVSNVVFKNVKLMAGNTSFECKYKDVTFEDVSINGTSFTWPK